MKQAGVGTVGVQKGSRCVCVVGEGVWSLGGLHGGGGLWNNPPRMRIISYEVSSKLLSPWLERVDFMIHYYSVHYYCSLSSSSPLGRLPVCQGRSAASTRGGAASRAPLIQWFLSCSIWCEEKHAPEPHSCEHWGVHFCR